MQLNLHNCLTTKKMAIAVEKCLNTSSSSYANFQTASLTFWFIWTKSLHPLNFKSPCACAFEWFVLQSVYLAMQLSHM